VLASHERERSIDTIEERGDAAAPAIDRIAESAALETSAMAARPPAVGARAAS
jgi:hypothetical protein